MRLSLPTAILIGILLCIFGCSPDGRRTSNEPVAEQWSEVPLLADGLRWPSGYECIELCPDKREDIRLLYFQKEDTTLVVEHTDVSERTLDYPDSVLYTYMKLGHEGDIIEQLSFKGIIRHSIIGGLLTDGLRYSTWPRDGDSTWLDCQLIELPDSISESVKDSVLTRYYERSEAAEFISLNRNGRSVSATFFVGEEPPTTLIGAPLLSYVKEEDRLPAKRKPGSYFEHDHWLIEDSVLNGHPETIRLEYFHKQFYTPERTSGAFNPISQTFPAHWSGEGYFALRLNADTLRFHSPIIYQPDSREKYALDRSGQMTYFDRPEIAYRLFSTHPGSLYLLRRETSRRTKSEH